MMNRQDQELEASLSLVTLILTAATLVRTQSLHFIIWSWSRCLR